MQEHAYPASNEPLIFSRIMVGILDDDVIEVQILYRLYHAGIPIKALDRDKVAQTRRGPRIRAVAQCACHTHRACRIGEPCCSRPLLGPAACGIRRTSPQSRHHDVWEVVFSKAEDRPYPALVRLANSSHS
jgi:hypothetical protein